jgi:hypothetical protein
MTRARLTFSVAIVLLAFASRPVFAQGKPSESGSPHGAGAGSGHSGPGASSGGGGGGGGGGSSGGGVSTPSSGGGVSGGGDRDRAVPRGGSAPERRAPASVGRTSPVHSSPSGGGDGMGPVREVPEYGRPRAGRPATGTAVARSEVPFARPEYWTFWMPNYRTYFPYGVWSPGYFGTGFFYYDPFWWGDPWYYGSGYYGYGYGGGYGRSYYAYGDYGRLRLKVKPREAQVYVDGYFSGIVDQFDGVFQRLPLKAGSHRVEIRAEGYQPLAFEVMIIPHETVTYKGELRRAP